MADPGFELGQNECGLDTHANTQMATNSEIMKYIALMGLKNNYYIKT